MPTPDAFSLSEGAVFHDQYEVVRRIDSGAMGTVYEVIDRRTRRRRALKIMLARFADNPEVVARFRREATITADVVSEHVVETFDAGVDPDSGLPFLVMELLRGEDLGKIVARGAMPASEVVTLLMQASSALDKMHSTGIVHRDLKPENLFVTRRDDGAPRIKILDFGIAKVIEKSAPSATTTRNMGTPVYMSPEQVTGAGVVGPPADLYAVGHLAYAMLTGEAYWLEDALAHETVYPLLLRIMEGAVEPASARALRTRNVTLPPAFDAWFAKATAKAVEDRFPNASTSIVQLSAALGVPQPSLPSWILEEELASAPTDAPPARDSQQEQPILLVPPASPVPKHLQGQREGQRTLSPVSTLPLPPAKQQAPPAEPRRRRGLWVLGAAFFLIGSLLTVFFVRPVLTPDRASPATSGSSATLSVETAVSAAPVTTEPSVDPTASSGSSEPEPTPTAEASASATAQTVSKPVVRPALTPRRPAARPSTTKSSPRPSRPYGDPTRDL